jgi:hypothetical protein
MESVVSFESCSLLGVKKGACFLQLKLNGSRAGALLPLHLRPWGWPATSQMTPKIFNFIINFFKKINF